VSATAQATGARSLSFGAFLNSRWLPGKRLVLAASTYNGYRRNVEGHVVPALGRIGLRRLRPHHLEAFYDGLLHPRDGRAALAPKTVYEILGCNYSVHTPELQVRGSSCVPAWSAGMPPSGPLPASRGDFAEPSLRASTQPLNRSVAPAPLKPGGLRPLCCRPSVLWARKNSQASMR
jgi:hypothetical protein